MPAIVPVAPLGAAIAHQAEQLGTGHAVMQAEAALAGFDGDVLILYGDVPLVGTATMRAMLDRLNAADAPAVVVLGFRPADPGAYGRVIVTPGTDRVERIVEFKDAGPAERAETLCNSGLMAARSADLFALLGRLGNDNAAGEYYLTDIVALAGGGFGAASATLPKAAQRAEQVARAAAPAPLLRDARRLSARGGVTRASRPTPQLLRWPWRSNLRQGGAADKEVRV